MRLFVALTCITLLFFSFFVPHTFVYSDELTDLTKQIEDLREQLDASKKATEPLESELDSMTSKMDSLEARVAQIERDLATKRKQLEENYAKLDEKKELFDKTVRDYYMKNRLFSPLFILASGTSASDVTHVLALQAHESKEEKSLITSLALTLVTIEKQKAELEDEEEKLAAVKSALAVERDALAKVVKGAKDYQAEVSGKIAELSAKQQKILNARGGTFTTSVGDVPLTDDPNASPGYDPGFSPAFGAFSFGAYTHRNGMSQYGAKARADNGQDYKQILSAYFPGKEVKEGYGEPSTITVDGYGAVDFQQYLYGIAEMPSSWNKEALKAQAVAARSYALAYTNNGSRPICATQSCQVYIGHSKGGAWEQAVNETRGVVLAEGGSPVSTQYSSTTGGYLNTSGWDTKCGSKDCWTQDAWEKIAGSPWFYKGWYTQSYSNSSAKCGRAHPWLNNEEMADILNAWIVRKNPSGADTGRIIPTTINECPINGVSGNPYSIGELREKANNSGGAVTSVSSVSVSYSSNGHTAQVNFNTNRGNISISGGEFKDTFNLRAPGYISIRSPLFNIENK